MKITRIENVKEGTGVEREDDTQAFLTAMHELWAECSKIKPPKYIPVQQWVLDAFDEARAEQGHG